MQAYQNKEGSQSKIAKRFGVGRRTVQRLWTLFLETGSVNPRPHGGGNPARLGPQELAILKKISEKRPDATLEELGVYFDQVTEELPSQQAYEVASSSSVISRALTKLNLTRKKKSRTAAERNTPEIEEKKRVYEAIVAQIVIGMLFFLDETGCNLAMNMKHARSLCGERAYASERLSKGKNQTVVGIIGVDGIVAWSDFTGAMTYPKLLSFFRANVYDVLPFGSTVVMDNHSGHVKLEKEAKAELAEHGIKIVLLPPYHPELNPIEYFWSRFKSYIRKRKANFKTALLVAIDDAFEVLGPDSARNLFKDCGYGNLKQSASPQ